MSSWAPPIFVSAAVAAALIGYTWNLLQASATINFKETLRERGMAIADTSPDEWQVPAGAFALLLNDDGTVEHEINADRVRNTNFLKDNDARTSQLFHKIKARALTGGGYVTFKWVNPVTDELQPFIAYATRNKNNKTTCIAQSSVSKHARVEK